jgi:hypothetical protein
MKILAQLLLGSLLLTGAQFLLTGCYSEGYVSETVYYGPHRDPWFRDDPWMDNRRWYRDEPRGGTVDIYISPPRHRR